MRPQTLQQGINAILQGRPTEGGRLIRYAFKNDPLSRDEQVQGLSWLAHIASDLQSKVGLYQQALQLDPGNQAIIQRLNQLMGQGGAAPQPPNGNPPNTMPPINTGNWTGNTSHNMPPINDTGGFPNSNQGTMPPINTGNWTGNTSHNMPPLGDTGGFPNNNQGTMPPINTGNWTGNTSHNMPPLGDTGGFPNSNQGTMPPINTGNWTGNTSHNMPPLGDTGGFPNNTPEATINPLSPDDDWHSQSQPQGGQRPNHSGGQGDGFGNVTGGAGGNNFGSPPPQQQSVYLKDVQRTVGIRNGMNGNGTGFFVSRDGLVVTTRHVVGSAREVGIVLLDGRTLHGEVVRAFPQFDITLIQTPAQVERLLSITQEATLPDNAPLVAVNHAGQGYRTTRRQTRHAIERHWFPTMINYMEEAGGEPVFEAKANTLVGMMTRNASRSNAYLFGLHIHKIYQCVEMYKQEQQNYSSLQTEYCENCGNISRAPQYGGHSCERCGATLFHARNQVRGPQPQLGGLYGENMQQACPNCGSQAGFYDGKCLRCGHIL